MSLLDPSLATWILVFQIGLLETLLLVNLVKFRAQFLSFIHGFADPESRKALFGEIAHGVLKAASERAGAVRGATSRQAEALMGADVSGIAIQGLASFLPKKYQAFAPLIAPYIQQFLERNQGFTSQGSSPSSSNSGGGLPP